MPLRFGALQLQVVQDWTTFAPENGFTAGAVPPQYMITNKRINPGSLTERFLWLRGQMVVPNPKPLLTVVVFSTFPVSVFRLVEQADLNTAPGYGGVGRRTQVFMQTTTLVWAGGSDVASEVIELDTYGPFRVV